jgi:hypothetical protein
MEIFCKNTAVGGCGEKQLGDRKMRKENKVTFKNRGAERIRRM